MANLSDKELVELSKSKDVTEKLSSMNRCDLLPCLFRVKGEPFSLKGREQFSVLFAKEMVRETIVLSGRQLGKCEITTEKDDFLTLRDHVGCRLDTTQPLPVGTSVAAENNSKAVSGTVTSYMSPGVKPILKITTDLGNVLRVTSEHKIRTFDGYIEAGKLSVGSRVASMRKCYDFGSKAETDYRIRLTAYFIGNGHCGNIDGTGMFELTARKQMETDAVKLAEANGDPISVRDMRSDYVRRVRFHVGSDIRQYLVEDGLAGKYSWEKYIPDWVFELNRECTIEFVKSLWSADGNACIDKRGFHAIEYSSSSPLLVSDLRALLSKFGIATKLRIKKTGYKKDGVYKGCRDAYIIRVYGYKSQKIFLDTFNLLDRPTYVLHDSLAGQNDRSNRDTLPTEGCALIGKLASYLDDPNRPGKMKREASLNSLTEIVGSEVRRKPKYNVSRFKLAKYLEAFKKLGLEDKPEYVRLKEFAEEDVIYDRIVSIEPIGDHPTFDIEVEEHHNFIHSNICVHNSMSLSRSEIFNLLSIPNFQELYIAPLQEQARTYSNLYVNEAIQSCPLAQKLQDSSLAGVLSDAKIIKTTGHQSFANGAGIQMTYAKFSADRTRGKTADQIDFDEIQDQSSEVIPIIQESMTSSKFGCSRYTGTAKVKENLIEHKWQQSSQCEWVMKCHGCGYYNIPNLDGKVLQMIQADGMHCVHCGKKLDVKDGQWIAAFPDRMKTFRGYHIPQVVCPFIVENRNNWDKLLHKLMNGVLATFIQENLGISYSVGQRLITQADLVRQSCLPDIKTLQDNLDRYSYTVAGIDWGGAELQSFTVITVIGIRPDGRIDVLWAKRYRGFDPDDQLVDIAKTCRFYGCTAVAADLGMGMDKNLMLVKRFGLPVVQIMYTRQNKLFGKNKSGGATGRVQCWTVDKVTALDVLFMSIKNGRIFFPKTGMDSFFPDILSPYESTTEVGGMEHRIYLRSEGQPDDFCHALCFSSMVAMKLMGMAVDDMIPETAFGRGLTDGRPTENVINPRES